MNISEKLDFLMNLTNTKNSALGKALSFDPSYISRIRSGSRGIPKSQPFTAPLASYFARNLKEGYQLETAASVIGGGALPSDRKKLEDCLYEWLENNSVSHPAQEPIAGLISDMSNMLENVITTAPVTQHVPVPQDIPESNSSIENIVPTAVFYGNQGKRDSVKKFLTSLLNQKKAFQLYLFSDEDMTWLYEKPEFARQWAMLLIQLMQNGSRIQIIHTISRNLTELMEAIRKWVPLYSTGAIEPYYYPMLRDGIYHRSLFIASGHSALISTSVENKTEGMANFFIRNEEVVSSLELEYRNYLSLCKPLMTLYTPANKSTFLDKIIKKDSSGGNYMIAQPFPSLWSMPEKVAHSIAKRAGNEAIVSHICSMNKNMTSILENGGSITEIISLPNVKALKDKKFPIPMSDMMSDEACYYEPAELISHLQAVKKYNKKYPNYKVTITDMIPSTVLLLSHLEAETILSSAAAPTYAFVVSHQQFSSAFYEYLERITGSEASDNISLDEYISSIK